MFLEVPYKISFCDLIMEVTLWQCQELKRQKHAHAADEESICG